MEFELISIPSDDLYRQFEEAVSNLLYPSESDYGFTVHRFQAQYIGDSFSKINILREFYHDQPVGEPLQVEWAVMERLNSNGYYYFFRHFTDYISQTPGSDGMVVWEPEHRTRADLFQRLRDLWMKHLIRQRWFKVHLPDGANKTILIAGQLLQIEYAAETGEMITNPSDWFVLQTGTVET